MGDATIDSDHVSHVFQAQQGSWYTNHMNDIAEKNYVENTLEPLGKPYVRGHNLPAVTKEKGFAFGLIGETCESAKNLLYPQSDSDEAAHHDQYVRSHGSYQPGEQRTRGYKWENTPVHPGVHRFGVKPVPTFDGVSECLHPTSDSQSRLISTRVDAYKDMTKDKLGQAKNLGMEGGRNLPADHAFGVVKKVEHDHWGTAECIQGDYSITEQLPDSDLGRSIAPGYEAATKRLRSGERQRERKRRETMRRLNGSGREYMNNDGVECAGKATLLFSSYVSHSFCHLFSPPPPTPPPRPLFPGGATTRRGSACSVFLRCATTSTSPASGPLATTKTTATTPTRRSWCAPTASARRG